jgi:hypothetical protein
VTPIRAIEGSATGLFATQALALDSTGDVYAANFGGESSSSVTVYPADANGNVAPSLLIAGSKTKLGSASGIAVDANDDVYVSGGDPYGRHVNVYAAGNDGDVRPIRAIVVADSGGLAVR